MNYIPFHQTLKIYLNEFGKNCFPLGRNFELFGNPAHTKDFLALGKALKIWIYNQVLFLNTSDSVFQKH